MNNTNSNPPAFPRPAWDLHTAEEGWIGNSAQDGMTLLDYFAGQALSGWLASYPSTESPNPSNVAVQSYKIAEAMLIEREKRSNK